MALRLPASDESGDNLGAEVTALKEQPGADLLLTGGANLAAALTELGLIDEYHVAVHPVVLGGGRKLFAEPKQRLNLRTGESRLVDGRVVVTSYHRSWIACHALSARRAHQRYAAGVDMRAKNKQAVREAISSAALRLALDQGPDGLVLVRVADIASSAGVAPRTYNNYFASREEAICAFQADRARLVGDALRERPVGEPLGEAITAAVVEVFASPEPDRAGLAMILSTPALAGEALKAFAVAEEPLAAAIAERTERGLRSQVLAASVAAAVRVAGRHWLDTSDPPPFAAVLRKALSHVVPGGGA